MSAQNESKVKESQTAASIVWFEIPADDIERARKFYGNLFGWKIEKFPGLGDYWHIDTGGAEDTPDGALMARSQGGQPITNYVSVESVSEAMAKVEKLGGKICTPKTAVPQMGYFSICQDTESNTFALWEMDETAK
jgi:predicted enzyme related to lactoylglutathione lyase